MDYNTNKAFFSQFFSLITLLPLFIIAYYLTHFIIIISYFHQKRVIFITFAIGILHTVFFQKGGTFLQKGAF